MVSRTKVQDDRLWENSGYGVINIEYCFMACKVVGTWHMHPYAMLMPPPELFNVIAYAVQLKDSRT